MSRSIKLYFLAVSMKKMSASYNIFLEIEPLEFTLSIFIIYETIGLPDGISWSSLSTYVYREEEIDGTNSPVSKSLRSSILSKLAFFKTTL
jgi:hypothetical protein